MCSQIGFLSPLSGVLSFIGDSYTPVSISGPWDKRKICAIAQNFFAGTCIISTISSIFCLVTLSTPYFLLSVAILSISLLASRGLRILSEKPLSPIDQKVNAQFNKETSDLIEDVLPAHDQALSNKVMEERRTPDKQLSTDEIQQQLTELDHLGNDLDDLEKAFS